MFMAIKTGRKHFSKLMVSSFDESSTFSTNRRNMFRATVATVHVQYYRLTKQRPKQKVTIKLSALLSSVRSISFPIEPYELIWLPKLNVRAIQTEVGSK